MTITREKDLGHAVIYLFGKKSAVTVDDGRAVAAVESGGSGSPRRVNEENWRHANMESAA